MSDHELMQKIFTHVVTQARKMSARSVVFNYKNTGSKCAYRGDNNNRCFIGHIIPDDKYSFEMEEWPLPEVFSVFLDIELEPEHEDFLYALQAIHDYNQIEEWEDRFQEFAQIYNLSVPER